MFPFALPGKEEFLSTCSRVTLTLLLTERCNYRCQHCLYACGPSKSDLYMPDSVLEHAARAVQECSALEDGLVLNFIGGEISIDSTELARVVTWVTGRDAFFRVSMVTNGWFLQSPKTLAKIAEALRPLWKIDADCLRVSISNTPWHDKFRTARLQEMLKNKLPDVLGNPEKWYQPDEMSSLSGGQREAIALMAEASEKEKIYVQCRHSSTFNLIYMGRAEQNGMGRRSHSCSADELSLTVWPDGTIRHICDAAGKINFGHIRQGIVEVWALRQEFLARLHRRFAAPKDAFWSCSSPRCENCRAYAGYWLDKERPKFSSTPQPTIS